jgi:glutaredoxin
LQEKKLQTNVRVILYSKPGCHLCEEMKAEMDKASCAELYWFEEINIETEPTLLERYRNDIPVLTINGVEAFKHRLRSEDFKAHIESLAG